MNHHIEVKHKGISFQCELCPKTFLDFRSQKRHFQAIHEGKILSCEHCEKSFITKSGYKWMSL